MQTLLAFFKDDPKRPYTRKMICKIIIIEKKLALNNTDSFIINHTKLKLTIDTYTTLYFNNRGDP